MAIRNRIVGITEDPNLPGYGFPTWQDGSRGHAAPMAALNNVMTAQQEEDRRLAQNMSEPEPNMSVDPRQTPAMQQPTAPRQVADVGPQYVRTGYTPDEPLASTTEGDRRGEESVQAERDWAARQAPQRGPQPQGPQLDPHQARVAEFALTPVRSAYRPAYDPEKDAAMRRAVPQSRTTEVQAQPYDEPAEQRLQDTMRATAQVQADANLEDAQSAVLQKRIQMDTQQRLVAEQQKRIAEAQSFYDSETRRLQKEGQDIAARRVDQDRYFSKKGTFEKLLWVVGAALLGGSGSDAGLQLIQNRIQTDVDDQMEGLRSARGAHENELARLAQRWGSLEAAKDALWIQHANAVMAEADVQAASIGTEQAATQNTVVKAKLEEQIAARQANLRNQAIGQVVTREAAAMAAPRAASGGGVRYRTPEEVQKFALGEADLAQKEANIGKTYADIAMTQQQMETAKATGGEDIKAIRQRQQQFGTAMAELSDLQTITDDLMAAAGVSVDEKGNPKYEGDIPGFGAWQTVLKWGGASEPMLQKLSSSKGSEVRRMALDVLLRRINQLSGAAFSDKERENHETVLAQAASQGDESFANAIVQYKKTLQQKVATLAGAAGPQAVSAFEQSKAAYERQHNPQNAGIIGEVPR